MPAQSVRAQRSALVLASYCLGSALAMAPRLGLAARLAGFWRAAGFARCLGLGLYLPFPAATFPLASPSLSECQSGACPWSPGV